MNRTSPIKFIYLTALPGAVIITACIFYFDYLSRKNFFREHLSHDLKVLSDALSFDMARGFIVHKVLEVSSAAANLHFLEIYGKDGNRIKSFPSYIMTCDVKLFEIPIVYDNKIVGSIRGCPAYDRIGFSTAPIFTVIFLLIIYFSMLFRIFKKSIYEEGIAFSISKITHEIRKPISEIKMIFENTVNSKDFEEFKLNKKTFLQKLNINFSNAEMILKNFGSINQKILLTQYRISACVLLKECLLEVQDNYNIDIRLDLEIDSIYIHVDLQKLKLVFKNLFRNAIEAGCNEIMVSAKKDLNVVRIAISNNGEKIDTYMAKKIFKRYYTTKPYGTGIGLGMSKEIVERHGGQLYLSSRKDLTTFVLTIPISFNGKFDGIDNKSFSQNNNKNSRIFSVFIVDDEITYQEYLIQLFNPYNPKITCFKNESNLIENIKKESPDLIILDIDLKSQKDGLEIAKNIREFNTTIQIVIHSHNAPHYNIKSINADSVLKPMCKTIVSSIAENMQLSPSICIVDDDINYLETFKKKLNSDGIKCDTFGKMSSFIDFCLDQNSNIYSVIILDMLFHDEEIDTIEEETANFLKDDLDFPFQGHIFLNTHAEINYQKVLKSGFSGSLEKSIYSWNALKKQIDSCHLPIKTTKAISNVR